MFFRPSLKFIVFWAIVFQLLIVAKDALAVSSNPHTWGGCRTSTGERPPTAQGFSSPLEACRAMGEGSTLGNFELVGSVSSSGSVVQCAGYRYRCLTSTGQSYSGNRVALFGGSQTDACPANSSGFNGSSCTCSSTHPYDNGTSCSATPPACGAGQEWVGGVSGSCQAQCGADQVRRPEGCVAKPNCLAFETYDVGTNSCKFQGCPDGYYQTPLLSTNPNETRQTCRPNVQCGSDAVTGNGSCTCRDSTLMYDYMQNKCIIPPSGGTGGGSGGTGGSGSGTGGSGGSGGTGDTGSGSGSGGTGGSGSGSGGGGGSGSGGAGTDVGSGGSGSQNPGTQDPPQPVDESNTSNSNAGCVNPYDCVRSVPFATVGNYNVGSNWTYSMWGGSSSCPANKTYQLSKTVFTVSYQPVCSGLSMLRPILLIAATVLGVYIIIGFNKGT